MLAGHDIKKWMWNEEPGQNSGVLSLLAHSILTPSTLTWFKVKASSRDNSLMIELLKTLK